jgi:hypothetical protein
MNEITNISRPMSQLKFSNRLSCFRVLALLFSWAFFFPSIQAEITEENKEKARKYLQDNHMACNEISCIIFAAINGDRKPKELDKWLRDMRECCMVNKVSFNSMAEDLKKNDKIIKEGIRILLGEEKDEKTVNRIYALIKKVRKRLGNF